MKNELKLGIPKLNEDGFTTAVVKVEFEWKPPHCLKCKVFGHDDPSCPFQVKNSKDVVNDDGFTLVNRKKGKAKVDGGRHVEGINLTKPKPKLVYRKKQPTSFGPGQGSKVTSSSSDKVPAYTSKASSSFVTTSNSFSALGEDLDDVPLVVNKTSSRNSDMVPDSDDDEVVFDEFAHEQEIGKQSKVDKGASTPNNDVLNV